MAAAIDGREGGWRVGEKSPMRGGRVGGRYGEEKNAANVQLQRGREEVERRGDQGSTWEAEGNVRNEHNVIKKE